MPTASPSAPSAQACTCWNCRGTGTVRAVLPNPDPHADRYVVTQACALCHGSGRRTLSFGERQRQALRQAQQAQDAQTQRPLGQRTP